ncbi:type VI secretion system ImpA family N-terminal domain-containing protein [Sulfitobacter sp. F26204]|uniref:type VI secretion system protein TssA n=1 Tax=Sulfitobacter sp. F26204 TaxID=2996014 RepID=UPI00225DEA09|nr:type VI secretion system ImpA family N-terminal domain-containing protein [Sulfitobacter sp. F26204]MCX7561630.1 type VI secretion system ImpA family N-terminal domain-containing protein [Sulfitobacter sp. F26204]
MTLDELLMPVAADAPCGPDLDATMHEGYEAYYFGALGRLPSYYYRPGVERPDGTTSPDSIFDSGEVDIATERREIEVLLQESRDIRLLVLLAQWEALAGRLDTLADAIEAIALLLETYDTDLHPQTMGERRDALGDLNNQVTMVQPLQFLGLTGTDEVSLRKIRVAAGSVTPLQAEQDLTSGMMSDALSDPGNKKRLGANHKALVRISEALGRITVACQTHEAAPFAPSLDLINGTVRDMLGAISTARPELRVAEVKTVTPADIQSQTGDVAGDMAKAEDMVEGEIITSHSHARLTLEACEHYYRRSEPSSAALLLVTQARLLIGRPLIEAFETLLPEKASKAVVDFGPQTGFSLNIERLRQLTDSAPQSPAPVEENQVPEGSLPVIRTGGAAAGAMRAVESYFLRVERSSPVPILLQRARSYLERDFQSLVDELVPVVETNP